MRTSAEPRSPSTPTSEPQLVQIQRPQGPRLLGYYIDRPSIDWLLAVSIGGAGAWKLTVLLPLDELEPSVRAAVYGGFAAAILAFVTVAFTPLAILAAWSDTPGVRRLRRHEDSIRRQFLRSTLLMIAIAGALLICGVIDAAGTAPGSARATATVLLGVASMKMIRLTLLFWAILADSGGRRALRR